MRARVDDDLVYCDSCGLESYHIGEPIDSRARVALLKRGIDSTSLRARQLEANDFQDFDWLLAMDRGHLSYLQEHSMANAGCRISLFLDSLDSRKGQSVLDPYYGDRHNFESMLDDIEAGVSGWLSFFTKQRC